MRQPSRLPGMDKSPRSRFGAQLLESNTRISATGASTLRVRVEGGHGLADGGGGEGLGALQRQAQGSADGEHRQHSQGAAHAEEDGVEVLLRLPQRKRGRVRGERGRNHAAGNTATRAHMRTYDARRRIQKSTRPCCIKIQICKDCHRRQGVHTCALESVALLPYMSGLMT